ncbi:hypothetical protein [Paenibacillus macquariensis]|uniref:Lipoprotein n=1 Tax=Paenibacillus macquariensis TaxID=948756 RepID=A0ABY1K7R0_9BACL|nr:hypothetical protein [Paenibacillus macquariensis]MEC0091142.1 hypothetical protein [Paenibacillus macquariensis]OAB33674.1 hypothetical protein PMSM_13690 [Paenibacillus macquariensis subsp. macquariensis]SIR38122.1 hypothetical protein SAMN05421578_11292 [Paenibacillus macquariensis]
MKSYTKVASSIFIATLLIAGCSSNKADETVTQVNDTKVKDTSKVDKPTTIPAATPEKEVKETKKPVKEEKKKTKKLNSDETLALKYVTVYLNGTDIEKKKQFVQEDVYPDMQPLFQMAQSLITEEENRFVNPVVVESIPFEDKGQKGSYVLIQSKESTGKTKDIIILTAEGKVTFGFTDSTNQDQKKNFDKARALFKTSKQ